MLDCDSDVQPQGPAAEIIQDFVKSEEIWLAKYLESWHIATENGQTGLHNLGDSVETRHAYSTTEAFDCYSSANSCNGRSDWSERKGGPCALIQAVTTSHEDDEFGGPKLCLNSMRPVIEQRPDFVSSWEYQWMNTVYLENAASSSVDGVYGPENVLSRQNRVTTQDKGYNLHMSLNDFPWDSSCAKTQSDDAAFWSA